MNIWDLGVDLCITKSSPVLFYVKVTNCFCIPHKEYEEKVEADIVYAQVQSCQLNYLLL